jgi:hypothetical protein
MAKSISQVVDISNPGTTRKSVDLLPALFRTEKNAKFLAGTLDQLIQPAQLERVNGWVGSKKTPTYQASDNYISSISTLRNNYQVEPALIVTDEGLTVTNASSYDDVINQLKFEGASTDNLARLLKPEFYSYNPRIDWDKFVNFDQYYWMPFGPDVVSISGAIQNTISTYTVSDSEDGFYFVFTPDGLTEVPQLTLYRGVTYIFNIDSKHKFWFKNARMAGTEGAFAGVDENGIKKGTITLTVTEQTPSKLYYVAEDSDFNAGEVIVKSIEENSTIDVARDIIGKKSFTAGNGVTLSNGMRISFAGEVYPSEFDNKEFFVEGVGNAIKLVDASTLETPEQYVTTANDNFDASPFDDYPFDTLRSLPLTPDYVTINRCAIDRNPWSRYNRWVHEDVIIASAEYNNRPPLLPVNSRAKRPIVEFEPNLQLFNFGSVAKTNVQHIDTTTTDAFSEISGQTGYYIDGVKIGQGDRIIFTADADPYVLSRIYIANFVQINGEFQLSLDEAEDSPPVVGESILVTKGTFNIGTSWYFNGIKWTQSQQKTGYNQSPLFDVVDSNKISYGNKTYYQSDFAGTKLFGYSIGSGPVDPVLGFSLKYKNIADQAFYMFENYFMNDVSRVDNFETTYYLQVSDGFLKKNLDLDNREFINVWTEVQEYTIPLEDGRYDTSIGWANNPLNGAIKEFTLSELTDHAVTMSTRHPEFVGTALGKNNIRDLNNYSAYGTRLVKNKNPLAFAGYFISDKNNNIIPAIKKVELQYAQFKLGFLEQAARLETVDNPVSAVDEILLSMNLNKDVTAPYAYSDMVAFGTDVVVRTFKVTDPRNTIYGLVDIFKLAVNSPRSVLVYHTSVSTGVTTQLIVNKDYEFDKYDASLIIKLPLAKNDQLVVRDYKSTDGCYVPPTPSKLGLYPKFIPSIMSDSTYANDPKQVIQGHDGSLTVAFGDYRDAIILELERRIYNNIKVEYNPELLDINKIVPGAFRTTDYSRSEIIDLLKVEFLRWTNLYGLDFETNSLVSDDPKTWNYSSGNSLLVNQSIPAGQRGIYKFFYDTDRPHTHPWEMLGFAIEPAWWSSTYGSAPYTSGNMVLWEDLEKGLIKDPTNTRTNLNYARPGLTGIIPVDQYGNLKDPAAAQIIHNVDPNQLTNNWSIGDVGPVESAWMRSSNWPFAVQVMLALSSPASYTSLLYDTSRISKNLANQYVYDSGNFPAFADLSVFTNVIAGEVVRSSGYSVMLIEANKQKNRNYVSELTANLSHINMKLLHKVGGFVSKDKLEIVIDSVNPATANPGTALSNEDYELFLDQSTPIGSLSISGIIVQRTDYGYSVRGYDKDAPYFTCLLPIRSAKDPVITIGGKNESFVEWAPSVARDTGLTDAEISTAVSSNDGYKFYKVGQIVKYNNLYYRVTVSHTATSTFNAKYFQQLPALPRVGGITVIKPTKFSSVSTVVPYGKVYSTEQEVFDIIQGYGHWLESQGATFDEYQKDLDQVLNWVYTGKEFIYWASQGWSSNSAISLSPFAAGFKYQNDTAVVDSLVNSFYEYSVLKVDGTILGPKFINVNRANDIVTIETTNTTDGIFFIKLVAVQKEHSLIFNNTSLFNDIVYDVESGYRQRRLQINGFRTANWNGDLFSPGFIYDEAIITNWQKFTDYKAGDVVRFAGNYYSAIKTVVGSTDFEQSSWKVLGKKPVAQLLPNFDYKISQFEDFYSLDADNFDSNQQQLAQHLTGYTPRPYLDNIFTDPISQYKFYQGFIKEKGTRNTISKLRKASTESLNSYVDFYEEWAFRIGEYGAFSSDRSLEFTLDEAKFKETPQLIKFVETAPVNPNENIIFQEENAIVIKPDDYNNAPFLTTSSIYTDNMFQLPVAGYVRLDDVSATAFNKNSLLDISNNRNIKDGDTVWLAFKDNNDWDVYRYTQVNAKVTNVSILVPGNTSLVTTDIFHGLAVGNLVSITQFDDQINGVYEIKEIPDLDQFVISSTKVSIVTPFNPAVGLIFKFVSARYTDIDKIAQSQFLGELEFGEKIWVDNDGSGKWAVLEKQDAYTTGQFTPVVSTSTLVNQQFAYDIAVNTEGTKVLISAPSYADSISNGRVYAYTKTGTGTNSLVGIASFVPNVSASRTYYNAPATPSFGRSLAFDPVNDVIIIGAPTAGYVKTNKLTTGTFSTVSYSATASNYLNEGFIKLSQFNFVDVYQTSELVLSSPFPEANAKFGSKVVAGVGPRGNTILVASAPGANSNTGAVYYGSYRVTATITLSPLADSLLRPIRAPLTAGSRFGEDMSAIANGTRLAIAAPGYDNDKGAVYLFNATTTGFTNTQVITINTTGIKDVVQEADGFAHKVLLSSTGTYLFISAPKSNDVVLRTGKVFVMKRNAAGNYVFHQTLVNPFANNGYRFGENITITPDDKTLIITSLGSNHRPFVTFDTFSKRLYPTSSLASRKYILDSASAKKENATTFDSNTVKFYSEVKNSGAAFTFNKINDKFFFGQELYDPTISADQIYGTSVAASSNCVFVGAPGDANKYTQLGEVFMFDNTESTWYKKRIEDDLVDLDKIKTVRTIDTVKESIVDYIEIIDPLKGKIPGLADEELTFKTAFDPAIYSIGVEGLVVDTSKNWIDEHVGELWWDLSSIKYVWYEQGELDYRKNNWGGIFPGCTVDVYEWVKSEYLPSQWATIADTNDGLSRGISGQPKFSDNAAISVKQVWNSVSNSLSNVYYYWVKNKVTVPAISDRKMSSYDVASLIADPKGQGMKFAGIVASNALIVSHLKQSAIGTNINLSIEMDGINNLNNSHTEWLLLQDGNSSSQPNSLLKKKVKDSLLGVDSLGNTVPDPTLSSRIKYGLQIRPRQTIFKDRFGALRVFVEYVNSVLKDNNIVDAANLSLFNEKEEYPTASDRQYDIVVEDVLTRDATVITRRLEQAELSAVVVGGRVVAVDIIKQGFGYGNLYPVDYDSSNNPILWAGPTVEITGTGSDAVVTTSVDSVGRVVSVTINAPGKNFVTAPTLTVRPFVVLVQADETVNNRWSLYQWNYADTEYVRIRTQSYNTTAYWKYIDWADPSYQVVKDLHSTIDEPYQLAEIIGVELGDYVKIKNAGDGRYIVVAKTQGLGSYSNGFDLIYQEKGSIQILDDVWKPAAGFDYNASYDQLVYDQSPIVETTNIVNGIETIFTNTLKVYANKLFFKLVKYALTEQKFLDWAFKTSFISVTNYAGPLDQRSTYKLNNETYYEDYLKEAKPFHTKIRNFQTNYTATDITSSVITDFDLPSTYDVEQGKFVPVTLTSDKLAEYPWKSWADNYTYGVDSVEIYDGGQGYEEPPVVVFANQAGDTGSGAKAIAYIALGKVSKIIVTDPGTGYTKTPLVTLIGGGPADIPVPARISVRMTNGLVRTNKLTMKFDRVSGYNEIESKYAEDTFISDGSTTTFNLTWAPNPDKTNFTVRIDGIKVLIDKYNISTYTEKFNGYTKKYGKITLLVAPVFRSVITVAYEKDVDLFNAADRIRDYYAPEAGMPGNTATLLMSGLEYPGVTIETLSLNPSTGFDTINFETDTWDNYAPEIGYYETVGSSTTSSFTLDYVPSLDQRINVYKNGVRIDDAYFDSYDGLTIQPNGRTVAPAGTTMQTFVGNGYNNVVNIGALTTPSDILGFRYEDSDGALPTTDMDLDMYLSGGDPISNNAFAYGYDPTIPYGPDDLEDIVIDGDKLVSPWNSYGPEETLPGRVSDTFGISVFTQPPAGSAMAVVRKYITTESLIYDIGTTPPGIDYVEVIYDGQINYDWYLDYSTNELVLNSVEPGKVLSIRTLNVGGVNVIENFVKFVDTAISYFDLACNIDDIKDSYITIDGIRTADYSFAGTLKAGTAGRAILTFDEALPLGSVVQVWIFASEFKAFSEVRNQAIVTNPGESSFTLDYPSGNIQPYHSQVIVEMSGRRLLPPDTVYYTVAGPEISFSLNKNKVYVTGYPDRKHVEVYLNGEPAVFGRDYYFVQSENRIEFLPGILTVGDVIAISILIDHEYAIADGKLWLTSAVDVTSSNVIYVYTFNNHDSSLIRKDRFVGSPTNEFRLSRKVLSEDYLWVDLNGRALTRGYDYQLANDKVTVMIDADIPVIANDVVVVTSVNDVISNNVVLGYRMFFDNLGRIHYKRLSDENSTSLAVELSSTSTSITVDDASVLTQPNLEKRVPGVILINGERIEFYEVTGNVLTKLRRATLGTGAKSSYSVGTTVIDQGSAQSMIVHDYEQVQTIKIVSTASTYTLPQLTFSTSTSASSQVEVHYQGRMLRKPTTATYVVTDQTIAYDSNEISSVGTSSNVVLDSEFTVTSTGTLVLNFVPTPGSNIKVVRKISRTWYENGVNTATTNKPMHENNTEQVKFLLERPSALPDKYYYGKL